MRHGISFDEEDSVEELIKRLTPPEDDHTFNANTMRVNLGISNRCDHLLHNTVLTYEKARKRCRRVGKDLDETMANLPFFIPRTKKERDAVKNLTIVDELDGEGINNLSMFIASGALGALERLYLNGNKIGDAGMTAFADAIRTSGSLANLNALYIWSNQIGDCLLYTSPSPRDS